MGPTFVLKLVSLAEASQKKCAISIDKKSINLINEKQCSE